MDEVTPQWTAGAARRRILDDAELGSKHAAVHGLGRARRLNRKHEDRQIEPGGGHESAERGRIAHRTIDGLSIAKRHEQERHATRYLLHRKIRSQVLDAQPERSGHAGPIVNDRPECWRGLRHPCESELTAIPLEIDGHSPMFRPNTNRDEPGLMTPMCASAKVLPIVG